MRVLIEGQFDDSVEGWCYTNRCYARALDQAGVEVGIQDLEGKFGGWPDDQVELEIGRFRRILSSCDVRITSFCFRGPVYMVPYLSSLTSPFVFDSKEIPHIPHIYYTMIERDRISPFLAGMLNRFDRTWIPCRQNHQALMRSGGNPKKVSVIPHPWFVDDPCLKFIDRKRPKDQLPSFYWIGRWEPRKAPDQLILAFMRAFRPGEAILTLKTRDGKGNYRSMPKGPKQAIESCLTKASIEEMGWTSENWGSSIHILSGRLPKQAIIDLHRTHDFYVSGSRGEGVDLPAMAAKLAGNRYVGTLSGGPNDFIGERDLTVKTKKWIHHHPYYFDWEPDARYVDYDVEELAVKMKQAASEPISYRWDEKLDPFRSDRVGSLMVKDLENVLSSPLYAPSPIGDPSEARANTGSRGAL